MKTIILIIAACLILKKAGFIRGLLRRCRFKDEAPPGYYQKPKNEATLRKQREAAVRYILTRQGYEYIETINYMPDEMLISIINEYRP